MRKEKLAEHLKVAAGRDRADADERQRRAERLQEADARAEGDEPEDQHEDRDRALEDRDVDRGRVVGGGVHERVEGGESEAAHDEDAAPDRHRARGAASRIGRVMNGASSATTPTQRRAVSAIGEMWPAARRLATALPAQASVVSARRR